jgi:hypothetical protein
MSDPTAEETAAEAIRKKAAANATAGIQSYTHGSRQVNRSDPEKQLDVAGRIELRAARRLRGFCANCDASGGVE